MDGIGSITATIQSDLVRYAHRRGTRTPARVAAAVGILLQTSPWLFSDVNARKTIAHATDKHRRALPGTQSNLLAALAAGDEATINARMLPDTHTLAMLLGKGLGVREGGLFQQAAARVYVGKIAKRCASAIREYMSEEDFDPVEDDRWIGPLAVLALIEPWTLSPARIAKWQEKLTRVLRRMRRDGSNPDLPEFEDDLLPKVWDVFEWIRERAEA